MDIKATKLSLIQWLTELRDRSVLEKIVWLREHSAETDGELTSEQKHTLDERLKKYKSGKMKFSSWDAVKENIVSRTENAI